MNNPIVSETKQRPAWQDIEDEYAAAQTWQQMASEYAATEILERDERIRDVESERDAYREISQEALHAVRALTLERDALRAEVRRLRRRGELVTVASEKRQAA